MEHFQDPKTNAWLKEADALARRINSGWWLDQIAFALPLAAVLATAVVLYLRAVGTPPAWVAAAAILPVATISLIAWRRARRSFIDRGQALVRLESALGLNSALSSAARGHRSWPAPPSTNKTILHWRWGRTFMPLTLSLLLVAAALLWPLPADLIAGGAPPPKPRNVQALQEILDQLREQQLVEPEDLDTLARELDKLGDDTESLYNPSTLEAADHLARRSAEALANLADASGSASRALQGATDPDAAAIDRAAQAEELDKAMRKMVEGAMRSSPELRDALKDAAAHALQNLDPEAAQQLEDMLRENQQTFQKMLDQLGSSQLPGAGENEGEQPGTGVPKHGPAPPAPLRYHGTDRGVEGGTLEGLSGSGGGGAPGELLELRAVRPPDPDAPIAPESAGRPTAEAGGGARLWKENLNPDEQRFLGEFYR